MTDPQAEIYDSDDDVPQQHFVEIIHPEFYSTAKEAAKHDCFQLKGGLVDAYFIRRSDILLVTFDNLASVGASDPPQPWMQMRAAHAGMSILGLIAKQKDWYRNKDAAQLIIDLRDQGIFSGFRRVVFTGTSMGGFAAITFSELVPGSIVLAFSPQSTLARKIVPFEKRYKYAARKWDWQSPQHLDAADAIPHASEVWLAYDPFVVEDKAHAARLSGPNVRHLHFGHTGHRTIRQLKNFGVLSQLIEGVAGGDLDEPSFFQNYRKRRSNLLWQRSLVAQAEQRGHASLLQHAARVMGTLDPTAVFPKRLFNRLVAGAPVQSVVADLQQRQPLAMPQAPFHHTIERLKHAYVIPERTHDAKLASGVLRQDHSYCDLSKAWIRAGKATPPPRLSPDEPVLDLAGTHLYGGHFRGHFGHFLVESTARLWALGHIDTPVDGIIYLPYRGEVGAIERAIRGHEDFFQLLGIKAPIQTFGTAVQVENLILPELGFGWSERYAGSPAYRAFMQNRLTSAVSAVGSTRLYISRAKLPAQRGGILGEHVIEQNLQNAGYDVFYPEKHSLAEQLARYRAAKEIIALDGSALHLAAYVLAPDTKVTMILRRSKANVGDYDLQFRSFCGIKPKVIDVIKRDWIAKDATRVDFRSVGELDFASLFDRLKSNGSIDANFTPKLPDQAEIDEMMEVFSGRRKSEFRLLQPDERRFDASVE